VKPHVALLRAVNVGGHVLPMARLRDFVDAVGFSDVKTLLQSGNVVFRGAKGSTGAVEQLLESEARKRLRLDTAFMVRTAAEWESIVSRNPFRAEARTDPSHLLVLFTKDPVDAERMAALEAAIVGRERVKGDGRSVYIVYPDGIGRSRLTGALIEKKLGTRGTARNWNTVLKLQALLSA
jgi:uncharacterized protein (DUF1697 family)